MSFEEFIHGYGYEPELPLEPDGQIHRFDSPGGKRKNNAAWYWYIGEAGILGDWRNGLKVYWRDDEKIRQNWADKNEERKKFILQKSIQRYNETVANQADTARLALDMWQRSRSCEPGGHPYLVNKKILPHHTRLFTDYRFSGDLLLVPLLSPRGNLVNVQRITQDGDKLFLKHGEAEGCYFNIGAPAPGMYVCEGFSTGATIAELMKKPVVCAMNAGNLMAVTMAFRRFKPVLAADNDHRTEINGKLVNVGLNEAVKVCGQMKIPMCFPSLDCKRYVSDFNDLLDEAGEKEARRQLKMRITV